MAILLNLVKIEERKGRGRKGVGKIIVGNRKRKDTREKQTGKEWEIKGKEGNGYFLKSQGQKGA